MGLILDQKTGAIDEEASIQSGAGPLISFKRRAEQDLWFFGKFVLGNSLLTPHLHREVTNFIQGFPPYRKLLLLPRNHYKSTISRAFCIHLFIQPEGRNIYFPNGFPHRPGTSDGRLTRILLASKTADLAQLNLGEISQQIEKSSLLKLLWPHCFWSNPRLAVRQGQAASWNNETICLPRPEIIREGSIETIGVGGTRTGYHFDVNVHDDLIDIEDRNSSTTMNRAIEWHTASRAFLQDEDYSPELILGTHWAVNDLYTHIIEDDPTVEVYVRSIVEDGRPIMPEAYSLETIERMKAQYKELFPLLYMNNAYDPELVDLNIELLRTFQIEGDEIVFQENELDYSLREDFAPVEIDPIHDGRMKPHPLAGQRLTPDLMRQLMGRSRPEDGQPDLEYSPREEYLRMRHGSNQTS